jgi:hypothetical protein
MADLAQILLLPPPTPPIQRLPAREQDLAVNAEAQGAQSADNARARRFRFRVVEGDEAGIDVATRRTTDTSLNGKGAAEDATADSSRSSPRRIRYANSDSHRGNSSAFLAQSFAQEQLGEGLHNPPFAAASAAYTRTGAALNPRLSAGLDIRA